MPAKADIIVNGGNPYDDSNISSPLPEMITPIAPKQILTRIIHGATVKIIPRLQVDSLDNSV